MTAYQLWAGKILLRILSILFVMANIPLENGYNKSEEEFLELLEKVKE